MRRKPIIALALVAVIIVASVGAYYATAGKSDPDGPLDPTSVTITDSSGTSVTIEMPITAVAVTNTNAAKFMQVLGVADLVKGSEETTRTMLPEIYGDIADIGKYSAPNGEDILSTGSKILITQFSSRGITNYDELTVMGIKVIRLDMYGETMLEDLQKFASLFGPSAQEKANEYIAMYTEVVDRVLALDTDSSDDPNFLFEFLSMKKPYSDNSELSKIAESIGAVNCIGYLHPSATGATSDVQAAALLNWDKLNGIDYILIRGTISDTPTPQSQFDKFLAVDILYEEFTAIDAGHVYVIDTDVLSGPLDYVGYVCIAIALGLDVGDLDPSALVADFNEKYGFSYGKTQFVFNVGPVPA